MIGKVGVSRCRPRWSASISKVLFVVGTFPYFVGRRRSLARRGVGVERRLCRGVALRISLVNFDDCRMGVPLSKL